MKFWDYLRRFWKENKKSYFIACACLLFGSWILWQKFQSPIRYTFPISSIGSFLLANFFAVWFYDKKEIY